MKFTSPVYSTASGSIAGITYSHNRYGLYTRARTYPVDPGSIRQQAVRSLFTTLVVLWNDVLTPAERIAWETWAANTTIIGSDGNPINITGQNAYIRFNTIRLQIGQVRVDAAPIIFNNGNPVTSIENITDSTPNVIGVDFTLTNLSIRAIVAGTTSVAGDVALFISRPMNATREFFKGPYQLAAAEPFLAAVGFVSFTNLLTTLLSDNGILTVGETRGIRLRNVYDDGRLSEPYSIVAPVVADSI